MWVASLIPLVAKIFGELFVHVGVRGLLMTAATIRLFPGLSCHCCVHFGCAIQSGIKV